MFVKPKKGKIHFTLDGKITVCKKTVGKNWEEVQKEKWPKHLDNTEACMYCHAVWRIEYSGRYNDEKNLSHW